MTDSNGWQHDRVSPLKLQLDPDNPRFELATRSQDAILLHLLRDHDVLALAKSIAEAGELWPTETILTYYDGKQHVVLEGNRRTAACKILLNPDILQESAPDLLQEVPTIDAKTRENIEEVNICFDCDRDRGDPIVANIHAVVHRRAWSLVSRMRYVHREFKKSKNPQEIAKTLKIDLKAVKWLLRGREALHIAIYGNKWTDNEKSILYNDDQVDHEPFLRAVLSPSVERHFGQPMFFDDGRANRMGFANLDRMVGVVAQHTLIAQRLETDDRFSKGDSIEDYLKRTWPVRERVNEVPPTPGKTSDLFDLNKPAGGTSYYMLAPNSQVEPLATFPTLGNISSQARDDVVSGGHRSAEDPSATTRADPKLMDPILTQPAPVAATLIESKSESGAPSAAPSFPKPKPPQLLEDIRCLREDVRLKQLTYELAQLTASRNNLTSFRLSLFMLMRALLEWALVYHYDQIDVTCRDDKGQHFAIGKLVDIASTRAGIFPENKKLAERASTIASQWLKDLHWNSHNDMGNWSIERLQNIAGDLRPILRYILMDAAY